MKNHLKKLKILLMTAMVILLVSGCSEEETPINEPETGLSLQIAYNNEFGNIIVNQDNQSMYFFAGDVKGERNCQGGCADVWPPVLVEELNELEIGYGLNECDFDYLYLQNGDIQLTYKGWPLYHFSPEANGELEAAGETEGDGRNAVFYIAKPDYTILVAQQIVNERQTPLVYLVDDRGVSLYLNLADAENVSNCNGGCAGIWPPFNKTELLIPSSLYAQYFYVIQREDELGPQLSFNGNPLYFFSQDEEVRGSVKGQAGGPNETFFVSEAVK